MAQEIPVRTSIFTDDTWSLVYDEYLNMIADYWLVITCGLRLCFYYNNFLHCYIPIKKEFRHNRSVVEIVFLDDEIPGFCHLN